MSESIRFYTDGSSRQYYETEAEAIANCDDDIGQRVYREVTSGTHVSRQQVWPEVGELRTA